MKRRGYLALAGGVLLPGCSGGSGGGGETTPTATPTPESTPEAGPVTLRVGVTDETEANPPGERFEVWLPGEGSWYPDVEFGGDTLEDAGDYERYSEGELFIYPDGRENGVEIHVTMYFDSEYISDSPRDMVNIEIHDGRVLVWGPPIEAEHGQFELEFNR